MAVTCKEPAMSTPPPLRNPFAIEEAVHTPSRTAATRPDTVRR